MTNIDSSQFMFQEKDLVSRNTVTSIMQLIMSRLKNSIVRLKGYHERHDTSSLDEESEVENFSWRMLWLQFPWLLRLVQSLEFLQFLQPFLGIWFLKQDFLRLKYRQRYCISFLLDEELKAEKVFSFEVALEVSSFRLLLVSSLCLLHFHGRLEWWKIWVLFMRLSRRWFVW